MIYQLFKTSTGEPVTPSRINDFGDGAPPVLAPNKDLDWREYVPPVPPPPAPEQVRGAAKFQRSIAVEAIKVTTAAGNEFDGDETSQGRMARAIIALQATGTPSVTWVLADNSVIQASAAELTEALALSGAAQAAVWVI